MPEKIQKYLDEIDLKILNLIQKDAKLSNAELAKKVSLSAPATHARTKRLEAEGFIDRYVAILNQEKLGFDLLSYVFISTNLHQTGTLEKLEVNLAKLPEVLECHCLTGEYDYLVQAVVRDRKELDMFVRKLNQFGVSRISTNIVLREVKNDTILPVER